MTEPYYNHPGEVREAMNFQCLHCLKIFTTPQGLNAHLAQVHNIDLRNFQYKEDWDVTTEVAGNHLPIVGRKSTYKLGDRKMKSEQEKTHNQECLVPGCGAIFTSSPGMSTHQKKAHGNIGSRRDVNWRYTLKPTTINNKNSLASQARKGIRPTATVGPIERPRAKRQYIRRQPVELTPSPLILSPDSKFIEIAAVIRVPISVGQAEIIQE